MSEPTRPIPWLWPLLLLILLLCVGCTDAAFQIQVHIADGIGQGANAALPILVDRYRSEGFDALKGVKAADGTRQEAEAALQVVKDKWVPIWKVWESLRVAQDAWATALESGGDTGATLGALKNAYCELRGVWPENIPAVPLAPLKCP